MSENKEQLLAALQDLGIDPITGRKIRSDKGKERGPNSHTRWDKGIERNRTAQQTKLSIYLRVKSRLLNTEAASENETVRQDINNYYLLIQHENKAIPEEHTIVFRGVAKTRTVRHVKGGSVDLEQYRFDALQELAMLPFNNWCLPYTEYFRNEIRDTNANDWCELFCEFYHIKQEEYIMWTYSKWRADYLVVCDDILSRDFKFSVENRPGTNEFLVEYAGKVSVLTEEQISKIKASKPYRIKYAKIRDSIVEKRIQATIKEWLNDSEDEIHTKMTMSQLRSAAFDLIDQDELNSTVSAQMESYIQEMLNDISRRFGGVK